MLKNFQLFSFKIYQITGVSLYPKFKDKEYIIAIKSKYFIAQNSFVVFYNAKSKLPMIKQVSKIKISNNKKQYYVLGIDKINSIDSREFGWIDEGDIIAQVLCKVPHKLEPFMLKWF